MTEDDNSADRSTGFNRRNVLKAAGAGVLITGATGISAAENEITKAKETKILTGSEKRSLVRELTNTAAFQELSERAQSDGAHVQTDSENTIAGYARGEDFAREIVEYDLEDMADTDDGSLVIGRNPDTSEIEVAFLDYYYETDDGILNEVHRFEPTVESGDAQIQTSTESNEKTVISVDTETIREAHSVQNHSEESDSSNEEITTQIDVTGCDACQIAAGQICSVGCGAGGGFICGFLGITIPVAGLSCVGFVNIVCTVADEYSGCGDAFADAACSEAGIC